MNDFEKLINASELIEWIMETYPDWCVGAVRSIVDHIEAMPSAQPTQKNESNTLDALDCVSRQAAIDALACLDDYEEQAIEALRKLPSAQPEIIRCRDCENWDVTWTNDWSPEYHYCPTIDGVRKCDFYCADAERRTDE